MAAGRRSTRAWPPCSPPRHSRRRLEQPPVLLVAAHPEEAARDLDRILRHYLTAWGKTLGGVGRSLVFPVVKVRAYRERWAELEASDNPFATVVMAHLHSQATRRRPRQRLEGKLQLVRRLYERGYARDDVLELFRFLDWVLALPPALEARFQTAVIELERERNAIHYQYRTDGSRERASGRASGRRDGDVATLLTALWAVV